MNCETVVTAMKNAHSGLMKRGLAVLGITVEIFNPGLIFELSVPIEGRDQPFLWSLDLFGLPAP